VWGVVVPTVSLEPKKRKCKKRKKISGSRRSAGSRREAFFAKSFFVPVFATPPFIPSFSVKHTLHSLCCCCCFFWGGNHFIQKLVMCFIYVRNQISFLTTRSAPSVARSLAHTVVIEMCS